MDPAERRRLLDEFLHPDLIPLESVSDRPHHRKVGGEPLDEILKRWGGAPLPGWRRRCPGGIVAMVSSFCRLARLLGSLQGAGWTVNRIHPKWLRLDADGTLRLRAVDLLEGDSSLSPDEWAPFLAPELLLPEQPEGPHGEEAGVYSLAAILHLCLAGAPPWSGRSEAEVADRLLANAEPTPVPTAADLPRGVAPLLRDAISLDPRQRPARFRGFAAALEAAVRGERPRSSAAHLRGTASQAHALVRGTVVLILLAVTISWFRVGAEEHDRQDLLSRFDSALAARPFPLHGEDPPLHPAGNQVLRDSEAGAGRWSRDPEILVALGWTQLRAGENRAAAESFQRARLWDPDSPAPSISLGIARLESGDRAGHSNILRGLLLAPRTPRERILRGVGELYIHRFSAAVGSFRSSIELDGPTSRKWFHLALAAHHAGDRGTAEEALAAATELQPHDVWIQWLGAERLASLGEGAAAIQRIESYKPEWVESEALLLRGSILLLRLGRRESAAEWWSRVRPGTPFPPPEDELRWDSRGLLEFPARRVLPLEIAPE